MNALMAELGIWIGSAATLGLIAGFFLCLARPRGTDPRIGLGAHPRIATLEERIDELLAAQQHKDALLDELQTQLERTRDEHRAAENRLLHFEAIDLDATDALAHQAEAQLEELTSERESVRRELEEARARNRSLQSRLDESLDRLVELERARMHPASPTAEVDTRHVPDPIVLGVEKSMPLIVQHEDVEYASEASIESVAVMTAPLVDDEFHTAPTPHERRRASEPPQVSTAPTADEGAERSLADLPTMPDAVKERLILIGVATNLAFLHKAGKKVGRRALIASTRLDESTVVGWLRLADLMRVGLRNEDLRALGQAGVQSLRDLARADAAKLAVRLQAKHESRGRGTIDAAAVQRWIDRARSLESLVEV